MLRHERADVRLEGRRVSLDATGAAREPVALFGQIRGVLERLERVDGLLGRGLRPEAEQRDAARPRVGPRGELLLGRAERAGELRDFALERGDGSLGVRARAQRGLERREGPRRAAHERPERLRARLVTENARELGAELAALALDARELLSRSEELHCELDQGRAARRPARHVGRWPGLEPGRREERRPLGAGRALPDVELGQRCFAVGDRARASVSIRGEPRHTRHALCLAPQPIRELVGAADLALERERGVGAPRLAAERGVAELGPGAITAGARAHELLLGRQVAGPALRIELALERRRTTSRFRQALLAFLAVTPERRPFAPAPLDGLARRERHARELLGRAAEQTEARDPRLDAPLERGELPRRSPGASADVARGARALERLAERRGSSGAGSSASARARAAREARASDSARAARRRRSTSARCSSDSLRTRACTTGGASSIRTRRLPSLRPPEAPERDGEELLLRAELAEQLRQIQRRLAVAAEALLEVLDDAGVVEQRTGDRERRTAPLELGDPAREPRRERPRPGGLALAVLAIAGRRLGQERHLAEYVAALLGGAPPREQRKDALPPREPAPLRRQRPRLLVVSLPLDARLLERALLLEIGRGRDRRDGARLLRLGEEADRLVELLGAALWREQLVRLGAQLFERATQPSAAEARAEEALADVPLSCEQGLGALPKRLVVEPEHRSEHALGDAAQHLAEPGLVHRRARGIEQRAFQALAPHHLEQRAVLALQRGADPELRHAMTVRVGARVDAEEEPRERPERRALSGLVLPVNDVHPPGLGAQVEREIR